VPVSLGEAVFYIGLLMLIALCAGSPDLLDAITERVRACR